ncbi:MAG: hypothetical protein M0Q13_02725 [Methanothrix sp.]|jgi:7-cyano-7-deazaguanine synthase in queuosine biosynthesis|nr:hypothetical protein [Methanothrix sp.]
MSSKLRNYQTTDVLESLPLINDPKRDVLSYLSQEGFELISNNKRFIVEENEYYKRNIELFDLLFYNIGAFYSIAANYFPKTISFEHNLNDNVIKMINLYYERMSLDYPKILTIGFDVDFSCIKKKELSNKKAIVALSGGKDSVYALISAINKYGKDNVIAVNINSIMKILPVEELEASKIICDKLGIKLIVVPIHYSFKKYRGIYNGAEIAMATALIVPIAFDFGIGNIILGTLESEKDIFQVQPPTISETGKMIGLFNKFLENINVDIKISSGVSDTKESLIYLMKNNADIMKETVSCMMLSHIYKSHKNRALSKYPNFPFYNRMCGVCPKCMTINVFRLRYENKLNTILIDKNVYEYCRHIFKTISTKKNNFKPEVIDEMEDILIEAMEIYEMNI